MNVVDLVTAGLATWRVSHMLVNEYGPFGIFVGVRRLAGIEHDEVGTPTVWPDNNLLACVWCLSMWVALVMLRFPAVAKVFSLSAIAIAVEKVASDGGS